jgi:cellulose synthase/poly-beta-1,6-N-acetylglucosamine synthase-like glycosyltransferase
MLQQVISLSLWLLIALTSIPVLVLFAQVFLAVCAKKQLKQSESAKDSPTIAVLVPARNESRVITKTINDLLSQLRPVDRILVVADNCSDDTADLARSTGVEVLERRNTELCGKGYALDFGARKLAQSSPDVMIVVDADCTVATGSLDTLAKRCIAAKRPVQALNLMKSPNQQNLNLRLNEFIWRIKNWIRPLGWHTLDWPCQLTGTGMAFPWEIVTEILKRNDLANSHLAEDKKLGIDLTLQGVPPLFCPEALITSEFPLHKNDQQIQRKRWVHGHLSLMASQTPGLLWLALRKRDLHILALALDLSVPPIFLLSATLIALTTVSVIWSILQNDYAHFLFATLVLGVFIATILTAWHYWGRKLLSFLELLALPFYLLIKLPLYLRSILQKQDKWINTKRP